MPASVIVTTFLKQITGCVGGFISRFHWIFIHSSQLSLSLLWTRSLSSDRRNSLCNHIRNDGEAQKTHFRNTLMLQFCEKVHDENNFLRLKQKKRNFVISRLHLGSSKIRENDDSILNDDESSDLRFLHSHSTWCEQVRMNCDIIARITKLFSYSNHRNETQELGNPQVTSHFSLNFVSSLCVLVCTSILWNFVESFKSIFVIEIEMSIENIEELRWEHWGVESVMNSLRVCIEVVNRLLLNDVRHNSKTVEVMEI